MSSSNDSIKKTTEGLKDPAQAAKMEARLEHMLKVGNENLKKGATDSMRQAMDAMNDPAVMQQMTQMMKDPQMQAKIQQMMKDPQFQQYAEAVSWLILIVALVEMMAPCYLFTFWLTHTLSLKI